MNPLPADLRPPSYQPLAVCLLAAMTGIVIDRFLPLPPALWFLLVIIALSGVAACSFSGSRISSRTRIQTVATLLLLSAVGAFFGARHHAYFYRFASNDPGFFCTEEPRPCVLEGRVLSLPRYLPAIQGEPGRFVPRQESTLFRLHAERLRNRSAWERLDGDLSVFVSGDRSDLRVGDRVRLYGELSRPAEPQNPGDFDRRTYYRNQRLLAVCRMAFPESVVLIERGGFSVAGLLETLRRGAAGVLKTHMRADTAPLAAAMLLGMRDEVDEETNRELRETGTIHILAISGLHIGLAALVTGMLLRGFGVPRRTSAILLALTALLYLFLTDVRPPAIRATVLVVTSATAFYFGRRVISVNSLAFTALVVLLVNPTELFQFGAQLSFLGTGVFLWEPRLDGLKRSLWEESGIDSPWRHLLYRGLFGGLRLFLVSLLLWLTLLPLLLDRIHLFTPVAVLVNPLLWLPLTGAILSGFALMLAGTVDLILTPLTSLQLATWCGPAADRMFTLLTEFVGFFHRLPYGYYWVPGPSPWWMVGFYLPLVFRTLFPLVWPRNKYFFLGLGLWCLLWPVHHGFREAHRAAIQRETIRFCSVGHGLAVVLIAPDGRTTLYDAGSLFSPERCAETVSRQLWAEGKTRIDRLVLSHPDADHYNAVPLLLERFRVGAVYVPPGMFEKENASLRFLRERILAAKVPIHTIWQGSALFEGVLFPCAPGEGENPPPALEANAMSIVLLHKHLDFRMILPGDIEMKRTPPFLKEPPVDVDLLLLPHHGGASSVTEPLFRWCTPEQLVISGGSIWRRPELIAELEKRGYAVYSTYEQGAITVTIDTNGRRIEAFRPVRSK